MKKYLIIIILFLSITSFGQNCSMLKNGKYEIQYDSNERKSSKIEIYENHYYSYENDVKKDCEIEMLNNCSFKIKSLEKLDETNLTELQKLLAKQEPYFEIINVEENIYYFICRVNLHVQCGSGKFIKKGQ